jgi:hypothetical protein
LKIAEIRFQFLIRSNLQVCRLPSYICLPAEVAAVWAAGGVEAEVAAVWAAGGAEELFATAILDPSKV